MSKGKTRLGLLGLCATVAMAIMAFGGASAAQAAGCTAAAPTAKPCWMLNSANVTADKTVSAVLANDVLTLLLSKALSTTIAIDCTEQKFVGGTALLEAEGKATGKIEFKKCTTELGGKPNAGCNPIEPIIAGGVLEIALHEKNGVKEALVKATNGANPFTTIKFNEETCTVPNSPVKGTGWLLDCLGDPETELTEHLIIEGKEAAATAGLGSLTFGTEPASLDGSLIIKEVKVGASAALTFSILAP